MNKKWTAALLASLAIGAFALGGCGQSNTASNGSEPTIGYAIYKFDDTFMSGVRNFIQKDAKGKAIVKMVDSQNSQPTQNQQVDNFIAQKVKAMGINPVDREVAGVLIDKAKKANIPIVFMNREPEASALNKWDKAFYVGAPAKQSGIIQGQILAKYFKSHPDAYRSHDGIMHLVIIEGEPGHQDAVLRTEWVQKSLKAEGIKFQVLTKQAADWDRIKGQNVMSAILSRFGNKIDAVAANNDDMALGAIEALKAQGYFKNGKFMPVVGVDATAAGLQAIKNGTLLGTVLNDAKNQALATFNLTYVMAKGETPTKANIGGFDITKGHYVWIPYQPVTKDNIAKIEKEYK